MSDYTKFQDVAYTVDAVVLYVSVAVELWDVHQGTSVHNSQTQHSESRKHATLVFISFFFIYLFLVLYDNHEWVIGSIPNEHQWMSLFSFVKYVQKCSFLFFVFLFAGRANNSHSQKE